MYLSQNRSYSRAINVPRQCDQTYPSCLRCVKRNVHCPGVKDWRAQVFKDETQKTAAKAGSCRRHDVAAPIRPGARRAADLSLTNTNTGQTIPHRLTVIDVPMEPPLTGVQGQDQPNKGVPARLRAPTADTLIAFFFNQITCPDIGWSPYLPGIFRDSPSDGQLYASVQAASLFVLANQQRGDALMTVSAWNYYGHALNTLDQAINNQCERLKDDVVCTILVLNLIEVWTRICRLLGSVLILDSPSPVATKELCVLTSRA